MPQKFETGDIIIIKDDPFGHVGMCCKSGRNDAEFIHATMSGDFHITKQQEGTTRMVYFAESGRYWQFRPRYFMTDAKRVELQRNAATIAAKAKYGAYRAVRLRIGDSSYGKGASERLAKYKKRLLEGKDKVVSTLTCAEAIILCYQLTFDEPTLEAASPLFILKDAAHTMPYTLAEYLKLNAVQWQKLEQPSP